MTKSILTAIIAVIAMSSAFASGMNAKEFHLARTEHMRKCQEGMSSVASGGQVCGGGVGGIQLKSTIIDTRSEEEKNQKSTRTAYYEYCKVFSNMTLTPVKAGHKPAEGCSIQTTSF